MFRDVRRVLVIKLRHIGDVLLSAPVFRALKDSFPDARVDALVNSGTQDMLAGNHDVNDIIVYDRGIKSLGTLRKYSAEASFLRQIRGWGYDMTVDLTSGDRAAIVSFLSGARYRLAQHPGKSGFFGKRRLYTHLSQVVSRRHMVLENLGVLSTFGIQTDHKAVDFHIPEDARLFVRRLLEEHHVTGGDSLIHVHLTSRWLFKCWKDESAAETLNALAKKGIRMMLTSSPDIREIEKVASIVALLPEKTRLSLINLSGKTTLKQIAAISEAAGLFLGVDSAPMHIAAAVGTPVVALFGPSGAYNWGPWDNDAYDGSTPYPNRNGVQSFGKHTVIQRDLHCVPCGKDGCGGSKISDCLMDISPEEVLRVLESKGF